MADVRVERFFSNAYVACKLPAVSLFPARLPDFVISAARPVMLGQVFQGAVNGRLCDERLFELPALLRVSTEGFDGGFAEVVVPDGLDRPFARDVAHAWLRDDEGKPIAADAMHAQEIVNGLAALSKGALVDDVRASHVRELSYWLGRVCVPEDSCDVVPLVGLLALPVLRWIADLAEKADRPLGFLATMRNAGASDEELTRVFDEVVIGLMVVRQALEVLEKPLSSAPTTEAVAWLSEIRGWGERVEPWVQAIGERREIDALDIFLRTIDRQIQIIKGQGVVLSEHELGILNVRGSRFFGGEMEEVPAVVEFGHGLPKRLVESLPNIEIDSLPGVENRFVQDGQFVVRALLSPAVEDVNDPPGVMPHEYFDAGRAWLGIGLDHADEGIVASHHSQGLQALAFGASLSDFRTASISALRRELHKRLREKAPEYGLSLIGLVCAPLLNWYRYQEEQAGGARELLETWDMLPIRVSEIDSVLRELCNGALLLSGAVRAMAAHIVQLSSSSVLLRLEEWSQSMRMSVNGIAYVVDYRGLHGCERGIGQLRSALHTLDINVRGMKVREEKARKEREQERGRERGREEEKAEPQPETEAQAEPEAAQPAEPRHYPFGDRSKLIVEDKNLRRVCKEHWSELALEKLAAGLPLVPLDPAGLERVAGRWPWMTRALQEIRRQIVLAASLGGNPFRLRPMLLVGPPGCGKTAFARGLAAELMGSERGSAVFTAGGVADSLALKGTSRGWASAAVSFPVQLLADSGVGNPFVIVDEVEKVSPERRNGCMWDVLIQMVEAETSGRFGDALIGEVDLRPVNWIATANSLTGLPAALLSRFTVVLCEQPSPVEHYAAIIDAVRMDLAREAGVDVRFLPGLSLAEVEFLQRSVRSIRELRAVVARLLEDALSEEMHMGARH